ncbi:hypothetical protein ACL02T_27595 [Pseudonocardia sp. RS010]
MHTAIGAIRPTLGFRSGLPPERLADPLAEMVHACRPATPHRPVVNLD